MFTIPHLLLNLLVIRKLKDFATYLIRYQARIPTTTHFLEICPIYQLWSSTREEQGGGFQEQFTPLPPYEDEFGDFHVVYEY